MSMGFEHLFILLIIFQWKQFLADFCFQNNYMLQKDRKGWDFIYPLGLHSAVHGIMTFLICLYFNPSVWWLAAIDFVLHFSMDRLRSSPRYLGQYNNVQQAIFWRIFGFDQMFHHLTHLFIIWILIQNR